MISVSDDVEYGKSMKSTGWNVMTRHWLPERRVESDMQKGRSI